MAEIEPKTREEKLWNGEDIEPVTREEMYIKHIFDKTQTIPDHPLTRKEMLMEKAGEGGGGDITIKQLIATENKTYSEEDTAYSPVIVNVPDVPPVLDELTVTENGTYIPPSGTDGYNEVTVSVPLPENAYLLKEIEDVAIASFNYGTDLPMPSLKVAIEPQQEGSGEPSPTNVRPISGWDECNLTRCGKNLLSLAMFDNNSYFTINGDGSVTQLQTDSRSESGMPTLFLKKGTYTLSRTTNNGLVSLYSINGGVVTWYIRDASITSRTFTLEHDDNVYIKVSIGGTYPYTDTFMIESGSTATEFVPFNDSTYTIDLDGTRYGGKVDVVSGVLTVDKGYVDLGTLNWSDQGNPNTFQSGIFDMLTPSNNIMCSHYPTIPSSTSGANMPDKSIKTYGNSSAKFIIVKDSSYSDGATFKTAMNGVQLVYELATPQTIQLTPTMVKSLLGQNNIFADCGNINELSYFGK